MINTAIASADPQTPVRELHWFYVRGHERQWVRLSLDPTERAYELHVRPHQASMWSARIERYHFASDAIERQCEYEADLLAAGFSLDSFHPTTRRD